MSTATFKPAILAATLAPAAAVVTVASNGEMTQHDKWKKAAVALYECGLRWEMIGAATKDSSEEVKGVQRATIKEVKIFLQSVLPEKFRKLLEVVGRDLIPMGDTDRATRKRGETALNTNFGRVKEYLKELQGIVTERSPKGAKPAKDAANEATFVAPENRDQAMVCLTAIAALCNTWELPAKAAAQVADNMQAALATLRSHKPKA